MPILSSLVLSRGVAIPIWPFWRKSANVPDMKCIIERGQALRASFWNFTIINQIEDLHFQFMLKRVALHYVREHLKLLQKHVLRAEAQSPIPNPQSPFILSTPDHALTDFRGNLYFWNTDSLKNHFYLKLTYQ